ncbi:glutamate synthase large subunit [Oscillibacter sp. 1-3]|uniref:glutamate synthase large subunit n=2 Tax=unclassified Oscillibacter TaxID=2629304 RepID=UPI0003409EAF|nr:glutamate synthase large subunit [Oscillibacter sp. 1-3]EOS63009.1 glutamate synthase (ferredoxin) [Oscillibacter sp. 1-3]
MSFVSPLYSSRFEHDACGIGAVVDIRGRKSHGTVDSALKIVEKLEHRAGKDAAGETGDGVGLLLQVPHRLMVKATGNLGIALGGERDYGVGVFFFPQDRVRRAQAQKMLEIIVDKEGLEFLGWRDVPVHPEVLGEKARSCMPHICHCFVKRPEDCARGLEFDRRLYVVRRVFEQSNVNTYIPSFSSRTIVYKGMFLVEQLRQFYADLTDPDCQSAIALVHSRFSTNTSPSWERAHPNRYILHNGEINTIRGNADRMLAREETVSSPVMDDDMDKILPVVDQNGSDSAMLDNTLEFLMMNGMELPRAVMLCIPEPWAKDKRMDREKRDFYHYYATMMEPWDGPAAIVFSDGDTVGAVLDRNGLRPCRWYLTDDQQLILSSEVGVLDVPPECIVKKSRLQPGRMLLADLREGRLVDDAELKSRYARRQPYGEWLDANLIHLRDLPIPNKRVETHPQELRDRLYKAFGYTYEEVKDAILPMARDGMEPTSAMGVDTPLAVLSERRQPLFNYFKQLFAQVTNPPIDAIREEIVTDTTVYVGPSGNLLEEKASNCTVLQIQNPILTSVDLMKIRHMDRPGFHVETVSLLYYKGSPLANALDRLVVNVDRAYKKGANIIILSDRGVDENHVAIPSLLAVSTLEQHLVRTKKRTAVSMVLESAEPRDVHHFATLLGYGAQAINPYLAQECVEELVERGLLDKESSVAVRDYNEAILHGIVKIASKMGISTIQSYQSAQIFECVGINRATVDRYFTNTVSRVEGVGLEEIGEGVEWNHSQAFDPLGLGFDSTLDSAGIHKLRSGPDKEDHMYNPRTILLLQKAAREGSYEIFKEYSALVDFADKPHTLRGLLDFRVSEDGGIPLEEVEPVESIVRRFKTGAMSYGSISREAHECMAIAMNRIGGKSNSGEGGEARERLSSDRRSAIKQVASGRFGVTSEYLVSADEIQIKMAQGAKPGEGGHLPGKKVYPWIARTRCSTPGVTLISPPPHHDIYSIEDLAQLIYDLKNANRFARISVKLVSEAGVGTIAAGVAKAGAQVVLISGHDGGTGAAPRSSIQGAGLPWELGVAEAHQTLIQNDLRQQVVIEADGKLMTGRDVAIACMLGAEEFGFATAPLVAMGCCMMRVCNLDTCPAGIATQDPELRKRFSGRPEYVENFMYFVARELREYMASLGVRTVDELVGRCDLLRVREKLITRRAEALNLDALLQNPCGDHVPHFDPAAVYDFQLERTADMRVLMEKLGKSLRDRRSGRLDIRISSTDRAFGTLFGSEITRTCENGLPEDSYVITCRGGGGQSFGAFIPRGLTLDLEGDCNDGFGKGLSGGKLILHPPAGGTGFKPGENIIVGNVALYGATGGKAFINGMAGERFCVRNSGASAVVEGVGDHGCEYMTGGRAVILGPTGKNFAAGMSGGVAYVLDERHDLYLRLNKEQVQAAELTEAHDIAELRALIEEHVAATGSPRGKQILAAFQSYIPCFKKVMPRDYDRMLRAIAQQEEKGMSREQAEIEAFYATARG